MLDQTTAYGMAVHVADDYEKAVQRTRDALSAEGFGVLTEIDVAATMKKKLDVDFPPYIILGACNPPLAYKALQAETDIGILLPCNVVVREREDGRGSTIAAMDPEAAMQLTGNAAVAEVASEVKGRLTRVLESLKAG